MVITTERVFPACPVFGLTDTMLAGGLTVKEAVFPLLKAFPFESLPEIDTLYRVGDVTVTEEGIRQVSRRVEPKMVVTALGVVVTLGGPAVAGVRVTVTFAGGMAPLGKFEPVTLITVTPAWPALGAAEGLRVTTN